MTVRTRATAPPGPEWFHGANSRSTRAASSTAALNSMEPNIRRMTRNRIEAEAGTATAETIVNQPTLFPCFDYFDCRVWPKMDRLASL